MNQQASVPIHSMEEIRANAPFPWGVMIGPNPQGIGGQVFVIDANRREVPVFYLTSLALHYTAAEHSKVNA